jgi:hypothetical protein
MEWSDRAPALPAREAGKGAQDKEHPMSQKLNAAIAVIGIDIGKNSFHIVGHDHRGAIVLRQKCILDGFFETLTLGLSRMRPGVRRNPMDVGYGLAKLPARVLVREDGAAGRPIPPRSHRVPSEDR